MPARTLLTLTAACGILAADLATKQRFSATEPLDLLPFLSIAPHRNPGGVFGFGIDRPWANAAFVVVSILAIGFLAWLYRKDRGRSGLPFAAATGLVLGGACGNLVDRVLYGSVRDWIDLHAAGHHWPTFNLADAAICAGTALLAWIFWKAPEGRGA